MNCRHKLSRRLPLLINATWSVALAAAGCEWAQRSIGPSATPVASVEVTPATVTLSAGATAQLKATVKDSAGDTLSGRTLTWASSNTAVGTVSPSGVVTAVAAGAATITATSEGKTGAASLMVSAAVPVASVTVSPSSTSVQVGTTVQLTATPRDAAGNPLAGRVVTWVSSNAAAATVSATGLVTGVAVGSATITATSEGRSGTAAVTVAAVSVASVTVTPSSPSVPVGGTVQLTATPRDANGNPLTGRVVTWASSNTAVATVNGSGLVTGVAAGTATIAATSEGTSGTASVAVSTVPVASVTVSPASATIVVGGTQQLTATPRDAAGNPLTGRVVTWSSSNTSVATVSASGLVSGVAAGTATITATSEGRSGTAAITVNNVPVASVTASPASATIAVGATQQFTATPRDAAGNPLTGRAVTWASSNTAVATVNASGLVTGVAAGTATITATSEGQGGTASLTVTAAGPGVVDTIFAEDFESLTDLNTVFNDIYNALDVAIVDNPSQAQSGRRFLQVTYRPGGESGSALSMFLDGLGRHPGPQTNIKMEWWAYLPAGWQGASRFSSIRGTNVRVGSPYNALGQAGRCPQDRPAGQEFFDAETVAGEYGGNPGQVRFYSYYPGMARQGANCWGLGGQTAGPWDYSNQVDFIPGSWHKVAHEVVLNDVGQANGSQRIWLDGVLVAQWTGLTWRTTADVEITIVQLQPYVSTGVPLLTFKRIDNLVVTRQR